jgi:hypothetical protein
MEEMWDEGEEEGVEELLLLDDSSSKLGELLLKVPCGGGGMIRVRRRGREVGAEGGSSRGWEGREVLFGEVGRWWVGGW